MRKIDKKINLQKANLLAEQRYLESKGILNESFEQLKRGDEIIWVGPPKQITRLEKIMPGLKGEYIGRETSGEEVVEFGTQRFYTSRGMFEKTNSITGYDSGLNEDGLSDYSKELNDTGDYPWTTFLGNKEKGDVDGVRNQQANEKFKVEFNNNYKRQSIETTNGRYFFETLKYTNNFGKYDLIFMKPKAENEYSDKTLWIKYDPSNGYYIDSNDDIELMDKDSVDKIIDMLKYNK